MASENSTLVFIGEVDRVLEARGPIPGGAPGRVAQHCEIPVADCQHRAETRSSYGNVAIGSRPAIQPIRNIAKRASAGPSVRSHAESLCLAGKVTVGHKEARRCGGL